MTNFLVVAQVSSDLGYMLDLIFVEVFMAYLLELLDEVAIGGLGNSLVYD